MKTLGPQRQVSHDGNTGSLKSMAAIVPLKSLASC
jgi:hypothetical protein